MYRSFATCHNGRVASQMTHSRFRDISTRGVDTSHSVTCIYGESAVSAEVLHIKCWDTGYDVLAREASFAVKYVRMITDTPPDGFSSWS